MLINLRLLTWECVLGHGNEQNRESTETLLSQTWNSRRNMETNTVNWWEHSALECDMENKTELRANFIRMRALGGINVDRRDRENSEHKWLYYQMYREQKVLKENWEASRVSCLESTNNKLKWNYNQSPIWKTTEFIQVTYRN